MNNKTFEEQEEEAFSLFSNKEFALARKIFQELCNEMSNEPERVYAFKFNIASCLASETKYKNALETLAELEVVGSEDVSLVYIKALCLVHMGKPELALQRLSKISPDELMLTFGGGQNGEFFRRLLNLLASITNQNTPQELSAAGYKNLERIFVKLRKIINGQFNQADAHADQMWQKNFAHLLFRSDGQYEKCSQVYEEQVDKTTQQSRLVDIDPEIVSNLCVAYILTGRNRDAEQLIKQVEEEEAELIKEAEEYSASAHHSNGSGKARAAVHLTRINLAVGTLYCVKNNYQFGIMRILDTLEPELDEKLTTFSWTQVKRCLLSLLDKFNRQQVDLTDELFDRMYKFLIKCEAHGHEVLAREQQSNMYTPNEPPSLSSGTLIIDVRHTVTYEAKYLRTIMRSFVAARS